MPSRVKHFGRICLIGVVNFGNCTTCTKAILFTIIVIYELWSLLEDHGVWNNYGLFWEVEKTGWKMNNFTCIHTAKMYMGSY